MTSIHSVAGGLVTAKRRLIADEQGRVGPVAIAASALASVTPLLVISGLATSAYGTTMVTNLTWAFAGAAVVLFLLVPGYVYMSEQTRIGGAIHAYVSLGLGSAAGVVAMALALVAYFLLEAALYMLIGPQAAEWAAAHWGVDLSWQSWSLIAWGLVTVLGLVRLGKALLLLAPLTVAEILISLWTSHDGLAHAAPGLGAHPLVHALVGNRAVWSLAGGFVGYVIACLGYEGWETTAAWVREARHPRKAVTVATFSCLGVTTVMYILGLWAMQTRYGAQIVAVTAQLGPGAFFAMGGSGWMATAGSGLLVTSALAGALAFHNIVARYLFTGARVGVLPRWLEYAGVSRVPRRASLVQSVAALGLILATWGLGWPAMTVFYVGGSTAGVLMMILLVLNGVSIIKHLLGAIRRGARLRGTVGSHVLGVLGLAAMALGALWDFPTLLGVADDDPTLLRFALAGIGVVLIALARALYLKKVHPERYRALAGAFDPAPLLVGDVVAEAV